MLIAHLLWDRVDTRRSATLVDLRSAYDAAMRSVDPELRYLWESLSANERRVLAALASDYSPYQKEARLMMGLANRSSAARAVAGLEGKTIVERVGDSEKLLIVDPLFARWVRRHGGRGYVSSSWRTKGCSRSSTVPRWHSSASAIRRLPRLRPRPIALPLKAAAPM